MPRDPNLNLCIPVCTVFFQTIDILRECRMRVCVSVSTFLHSEVSADITGQVLSVKQEVVADDVECQAGAPVGSWVI